MLNVYCVRTFPRCGLTHLYGTTTNSSTGSHTGPHALSNTLSTLVRVREILPIMCDSWQSTHVPATAIHVVTFYPSITRGLDETGASTVAQPVGRANATERQASASGSGLSAGGFAVDGFGLSWDFFDRGL